MTLPVVLLQRVVSVAALAALTAATTACLPTSGEAAFLGGRDEIQCDSVYPQCQGKVARCIVDGEKHYLSGSFPGSRSLLVETAPGDWKIKVLLYLDPNIQPRYPGTETTVTWYEPGCADEYEYKLSKDEKRSGDLFEIAGKDNTFEIEQAVVEPGDHLIEVYSDATTRYLLRIEVNKVER